VPLDLPDRIVFVVGKGGTGKTTAACAMALASADAGFPTHLLSTDPAHSIGDVLDDPRDLRTPLASRCTPRLTIEAFDPHAFGRALFAPAVPALSLLVEQGTWLDADDARAFLDLSLPGINEVMAALRIAELSETLDGRLVIDTAPTGHALRLFDAAAVLASWIAALDAMAEKADAVASAFAGRTVSHPARAIIQDWQARMHSFERALASAGFVVATREGTVVAAETGRLIAELNGRGLRHRATIVTGPGQPVENQSAVPLLDDPRGCDGLRDWWLAVNSADSTRPAAPALPANVHRTTAVRHWLQAEAPDLMLFAGKGGVGKSTCAAAVALLSARTAPTRLLSADPAGSLSEVLGTPVTSVPGVVNGVTAAQIDAAADFARLRDAYGSAVADIFTRLGIGGTGNLDQRVLQAIWGMAPPGLDEVMAVVRLMEEVAPGRRVILDTAPTGHFLNLLAIPGSGLDWTHALLRVLLNYRAATVLEGAARDVLTLARRLRAFRQALTDPGRTGVFLVTLDEPVVWNETRRLHESLILANIPVAALILNRTDAGPARGLPPLNPMPRIIRAPFHAAPVGTDRLLDFINGWEFLEL